MALKTNLLYDVTSTINLGYEVALGKKTTLDIWLNYNPWVLGHKWVGIDSRATYSGGQRTIVYDTDNAGNILWGSDGYPVALSYSGTPIGDNAEQREKKIKHLMLQPELRYWFCEKFNGHFLGVHLHGGIFNVGGVKLPFGWGDYGLSSSGVQMTPQGYPNTTVTGILYPAGEVPYPTIEDPNANEAAYGIADKDGIYTNTFEGWLAGAGLSYGYHWVLSTRFSLEFTIGAGFAYLDYEKNRCTSCKKKLGDETSWYFGPTRAGISLVYMLK